MDDEGYHQEALRRAQVVIDPRKFSEYVLVPGHPSGKDRIFLGTLGFRPLSIVDARELATIYENQARAQVASGNVRLAGAIPNGILCTIEVTVRGVPLRTGRLLRDDILRLITPFSGFVRRSRRG